MGEEAQQTHDVGAPTRATARRRRWAGFGLLAGVALVLGLIAGPPIAALASGDQAVRDEATRLMNGVAEGDVEAVKALLGPQSDVDTAALTTEGAASAMGASPSAEILDIGSGGRSDTQRVVTAILRTATGEVPFTLEFTRDSASQQHWSVQTVSWPTAHFSGRAPAAVEINGVKVTTSQRELAVWPGSVRLSNPDPLTEWTFSNPSWRQLGAVRPLGTTLKTSVVSYVVPSENARRDILAARDAWLKQNCAEGGELHRQGCPASTDNVYRAPEVSAIRGLKTQIIIPATPVFREPRGAVTDAPGTRWALSSQIGTLRVQGQQRREGSWEDFADVTDYSLTGVVTHTEHGWTYGPTDSAGRPL